MASVRMDRPRQNVTASEILDRQPPCNLQAEMAVLGSILKQYVGELWEAGEFGKLQVLEYLFVVGGRNKDAAARFGMDDETTEFRRGQGCDACRGVGYAGRTAGRKPRRGEGHRGKADGVRGMDCRTFTSHG